MHGPELFFFEKHGPERIYKQALYRERVGRGIQNHRCRFGHGLSLAFGADLWARTTASIWAN